jgi:flagellar motor switch protein FliM
MDKVLSQDEINALFSAMSSEDLNLNSPQPEKIPVSRRIDSYDFHRADRVSQDLMRSIHLLHEHFGRSFSSSLSAYLRAFVDVTLSSLEQISYSAFIKSLPDPTLFISLGLRPLDGNIALELNPSLSFPMVDMILGGPGRVGTENRNLTEIEMNIIEGVIKLAMRDLQDAWHSVIEVEFFVDGKGTKPQMFQIVSPAETVIAAHIEIKVGENMGMMNLCIPSRLLKQLRGKFDQQWNKRQKAVGVDSAKILELIKPVPVSLSCDIHSSKLSVDDLLKISSDDVIELSERVGDPIYLCVGGIAKFVGRIVQRRGKRAFEVMGRPVN